MMYEILERDEDRNCMKWLSNYHTKLIFDSVQFDLRVMGRRCSIAGPILRESELMKLVRVADEQDYRNALAMTCHGRNARWYESDDICVCGKMRLEIIGSRTISSTNAAPGPHAGTTLCRRSKAAGSIHIILDLSPMPRRICKS